MKPRADQTMPWVQAWLTRERPGANASAPAALSATAIPVMPTARHTIRRPPNRMRDPSESLVPPLDKATCLTGSTVTTDARQPREDGIPSLD